MPWGGSAPNKTFSRDSGAFSGATTWQLSDAADRGIRADDHDVHDEDIADGLDACARKDGGNLGTSFSPSSNDATALGTGALGWSDLFLASGGVINFGNGDVLATHSTNALTFSGAASGYTFQTTGTTYLTLESTDETASEAILTLYRNSASPAANDILSRILFQGKDSAGNAQNYNSIYAQVLDPTSTSEDSRFYFETTIAGSQGVRLYLGHGLYTVGATGGDQGANTINASAYYDDGTRIGGAVVASFHATNSGTQAGGSSSTGITLDTEVYDTGALFASDGWTPPAGKVLLIGSIGADAITAGDDFRARIYKDGVLFKQGIGVMSGDSIVSSVVCMDNASGSNVYKLGYTSADSSWTVSANAEYTYFQGSMV